MVRNRELATGGIVVFLALISVIYTSRLPGEVAIHFDATGDPDNYVQTELFFAGSVLLAGGLAVMFAVLPRIDPLGDNVAEFQTAYDVTAVGTLAFVGYICGTVIAYNLGFEFNIIQAIAPANAALFLVLAFVMRRAEQNWFVGIRTPWTLSDERVWDKTHRNTAPLFVVVAFASLGALFVPEYGGLLLSVPALVAALGSVLYSFLVYEQFNTP